MLELEKLYEKIEEAYTALELATKDYEDILINIAELQAEIEVKKSGLYNDGKIDGKNAQIREAQLNQYLEKEYEELHRLEQGKAHYFTSRRMAEIRVEKYRALLRIHELTQVVEKPE